MEFENISIEELLFDRQESFNDLVTLFYAEKEAGFRDQERMEGNLKIIEKIRTECKRRGFDPAQYDQVSRAKRRR